MARFGKSFTWVFFVVSSVCLGQEVTVVPSKRTGIYGVGERVAGTVSDPKSTSNRDKYSYKIKKNNYEVIQSGDITLTSGKATLETTVSEPAMLYVEVTPPASQKNVVAGAAVAPTRLRPAV